jgi:hypothetical protein
MVCTTQGRTWWPPVRSPSVPHANGASRILDCFAVAASAEGAAQEFKANPLCRGFGRDERCAEDAAEGATECGFEVDEWRVRVLVPEDSTGIAARWLDEETAGWIGIVVDVRDLLLAELALKAQGTEFERIETARGAGLLVDDRPRADRPVRSGALAQLGSVHSLASRWQERSPNVPGLICYPCARSEPPNSLDEFFVAIPEESRMSSRLLDGARETRAGGAKRVFRKGSRDAPRDDRCREARRSKSRVL